MKINNFIKTISLVVVVIFTTNTIAMSAPDFVYKVQVPEKYGKVRQRWKDSKVNENSPNIVNDKTIIILEDAHENFGAQKNMLLGCLLLPVIFYLW